MSVLVPHEDLGRVLQHLPHERTKVPSSEIQSMFAIPSSTNKAKSSALRETIAYFGSTTM